MSKELCFSSKARDSIAKGVNILTDAVKVTLGTQRPQRGYREIFWRSSDY